MIIAVLGEKGGTGKSTLVTAVAVALRERGRDVLVVDADTQRSVMAWRADAQRARVPHTPNVRLVLDENLHQVLPPLVVGYEVVLVDCPGRLDRTQRSALLVCDLALLPSGPSSVDASALVQSAALVARARAVRPTLDARVVLTRKLLGTVLGRRARSSLEGAGLPLLEAELGHRVTYVEAFAAGMGPTTYAPQSAAAREVRALATELEQILGLAKLPRRR